jgi:hypothetical protein
VATHDMETAVKAVRYARFGAKAAHPSASSMFALPARGRHGLNDVARDTCSSLVFESKTD